MKKVVSLLLLIISGCYFSNETESVVTNFGLYAQGDVVEVKVHSQMNTEELTTLDGGVLLKSTSIIPGQLGVSFGYCYDIPAPGKSSIEVIRVVKHPEMNKPNGDKSVGYSYETTLVVSDGVASYCTNYTFEEPWEIVFGEWVFSVLYESTEVVSMRFEVVIDDET